MEALLDCLKRTVENKDKSAEISKIIAFTQTALLSNLYYSACNEVMVSVKSAFEVPAPTIVYDTCRLNNLETFRPFELGFTTVFL